MKRFFLMTPLVFVACYSEPEMKRNDTLLISTEVVYRVELSASGSGGAMSGDKMILTESGQILSARSSEKAFFAQVGDTISVQGEKIVDIKFKE